jgi:hypothetical protein
MQFSKTRRLRSRGRKVKEWLRPPPSSRARKTLKTEQQLLDRKDLKTTLRLVRPVEVS